VNTGMVLCKPASSVVIIGSEVSVTLVSAEGGTEGARDASAEERYCTARADGVATTGGRVSNVCPNVLIKTQGRGRQRCTAGQIANVCMLVIKLAKSSALQGHHVLAPNYERRVRFV
jgi:hypothetical protein